ncbi:hypothetical protein LINPERHAP2_LOCUS6107 [Linum perenne]
MSIIERSKFWGNLSSLAFAEVQQRRSDLKIKKVSAEIAWTSAQFPYSTLNTNGSVVGQTGATTSGGALRDWQGRMINAFTANLGICLITRARHCNEKSLECEY